MRFILCQQASRTKHYQNKSNPYFGQWMTKATQLTAILSIVVGIGFSLQQTAQADTARVDDITIDRQPDETYDSLIQRAESAARIAVEQSFDQAQVTDVSVVILGQNQGVIAPVLTVEVSRPQWNNNAQDGFTYFNSARSLLRLEEQQLATADSPEQQTNTPAPSRQQPNNPRTPGSAREIINNAPTTPATSTPGATPLPGSPALVPRPQVPGVAPVTSPGDNESTGNTGNTGNTGSTGNTENTGNNVNTTAPPPVAPVTAPSPDSLPQVNPGNPNPNQRQDL